MENKKNFILDSTAVKIKEILNKDFLSIEIYAIAEGVNRNKSSFTLESMKDAIPTFFNKFILGYFNIDDKKNGTGEFEEHNSDIMYDTETEEFYWSYAAPNAEKALGIIRESDSVELVEYKGKNWLKTTAVILTKYNREAVKHLLKTRKRKVSVEITVLESHMEEDIEIIDKFILDGITILGNMKNSNIPVEEGIEGASMKVLEFMNSNIFSTQRSALCFAYKQFDENNTTKVEENIETKGENFMETKNIELEENKEVMEVVEPTEVIENKEEVFEEKEEEIEMEKEEKVEVMEEDKDEEEDKKDDEEDKDDEGEDKDEEDKDDIEDKEENFILDEENAKTEEVVEEVLDPIKDGPDAEPINNPTEELNEVLEEKEIPEAVDVDEPLEDLPKAMENPVEGEETEKTNLEEALEEKLEEANFTEEGQELTPNSEQEYEFNDIKSEEGGELLVLTYNQKREILEIKLTELLRKDVEEDRCFYCYICDMTDEVIIFCYEEETFMAKYAIDENGIATIDLETKQPVIRSWEPVPAENKFLLDEEEYSLEELGEKFVALREEYTSKCEEFETKDNELNALKENFETVSAELEAIKKDIFEKEMEKMIANACKMVDDEDELADEAEAKEFIKNNISEKCHANEFANEEEINSYVEVELAKAVYKKVKSNKENEPRHADFSAPIEAPVAPVVEKTDSLKALKEATKKAKQNVK